MGTFWKVGQWDRENAAAGYVQQLQKYAKAYKRGADSQETADIFSSFVAANDDVLLDDAAALRSAIDNGNDYAATLDSIAKKKQDAIKQNTGFAASMKNLGDVMKSIGASLLSSAIYAGVNYVIGKAFEWADEQINAAKYAKEVLKEVSAEWDELQEKQESAGELVQKYEADYDRLSKGVNMVTGENLTLSDYLSPYRASTAPPPLLWSICAPKCRKAQKPLKSCLLARTQINKQETEHPQHL